MTRSSWRQEAWLFGRRAGMPLEYVNLRESPDALARGGKWVVALEFDGPWHAWRVESLGLEDRLGGVSAPHHRDGAQSHLQCATSTEHAGQHDVCKDESGIHSAPLPAEARRVEKRAVGERWLAGDWTSSWGAEDYAAAVRLLQDRIVAGEVYQANICRMISAQHTQLPSARDVALNVARHNPAPYAASIDYGIPASPDRHANALVDHRWDEAEEGEHPSVEGACEQRYWMVSASPELSMRLSQGRMTSAPIKGTAATRGELARSNKDRTENIMITDVVRNDLARVAVPGTVAVSNLLELQPHPGLFHLVTEVTAQVRITETGVDWAEIFAALSPPASVSGAPKRAAIDLISQIEPVPRGLYCGHFGWIDSDLDEAELAVAIRTFYARQGRIWFGTGAGITSDSVPELEWEETRLKAHRLIRAISTSME